MEQQEHMEGSARQAPRSLWREVAEVLEQLGGGCKNALCGLAGAIFARRRILIALGVIGLAVYGVVQHPPFQPVDRGEMGLRINQWTGGVSRFQEGSVLVLPGIHELRTFSLRDQVYQPRKTDAEGLLFQSVEGLTLGVDFTVRYALDPEKIPALARVLPEDINGEVVLPVIQDVLHKTLSRYTVREIFSTRRQEIQVQVSKELQTRLGTDGIRLKLLTIGRVDLPDDYKAGMEKLLAAELETEQMRFTLELKEKQVKESELKAEAEKVRREKSAQAAAQEQIIAAQAQAEAMKHILPFKEKQIQQRALEAEAEKVTRLKHAQAQAEARRIEAEAEADSRKKLAEAEAYRLEQIGKANSEQMQREGALLAQNPLLIQKTLADKLSDKVQVIIAPPGTDGRFIGENLIGRLSAQTGNEGE
ncbi:MAG: prohibitin family protein [Zoogloeaceae bacterium]|jgi:regulator of protease activity HflC (stomatin/prohibitin superfamily)|nr:prohibitin family protein [Zoogloeaceae bacterium]